MKPVILGIAMGLTLSTGAGAQAARVGRLPLLASLPRGAQCKSVVPSDQHQGLSCARTLTVHDTSAYRLLSLAVDSAGRW